MGRRLNLPPQYLLVHRVSMGTLGVLCQLDARVALREIVARLNPATFAAEMLTSSQSSGTGARRVRKATFRTLCVGKVAFRHISYVGCRRLRR